MLSKLPPTHQTFPHLVLHNDGPSRFRAHAKNGSGLTKIKWIGYQNDRFCLIHAQLPHFPLPTYDRMPIQPCLPHRFDSPRAFALCVGLLVFVLPGDQGVVAADPNGDGPYFVLLRNGEVLQGSLERDGDHYMIRRSGTAELRIPFKDISHVASRMQALYEHRANRIIEFHAGEHLELASWCLQNGLEPQATHHILRAETIDPFHPHLSLLKARLEGFLANGRRPDCPASEIALMAAVGAEPIPITAAPIYRESTVSENSPPRSEPRHPAAETPAITDAPPPGQKTIDAPELIPVDLAATPINAIELPELIPSPAGPPLLPERKVNEDLIRQVEQRLAKWASTKMETDLPKPREMSPIRAAQLLGSSPKLEPITEPGLEPRPMPHVPIVSTYLPRDAANKGANDARNAEPKTEHPLAEREIEIPTPASATAEVAGAANPNDHTMDSPSEPALATERELPPNEPHVDSDSPLQNESSSAGELEIGRESPAENRSAAETGLVGENEQTEQKPDVPEVALPPELMRQYVANIQPMLLTRCGAANCHGHLSEANFKLQKVPDRRPTRAMTVQNLAATLEQLDQRSPADSPLFTWGQTAHGKVQSKLLAITNVQQQTMLLNWIQDVTAPPSEPNRTEEDTFDDRQRASAEGAERISLRKIKEADIRWQEPTQRPAERSRLKVDGIGTAPASAASRRRLQ